MVGRIALLVICFVLFYFGNAQNKYTLPQLTPHSPEAEGIGKYGEIPVSLSNGMANVSIPLLSVKVGAVNLPVTLTHHYNGLKVDEIPSWVGLGWDLSVGGVINYHQHGLSDFSPYNGMFGGGGKDSLERYFNNQMTTLQKYQYHESIMVGDIDTEYDTYSFQFLGNSGNFYFDKDQNIICYPKTNLKITKTVEGFHIVDEKGNKFYFETKQFSTAGNGPYQDIATRKGFNDNSSFLLNQITTVDNRDIIFNYTTYPLQYTKIANYYSHHSSVYIGGRPEACANSHFENVYTLFEMDDMLLSSIEFDEGKILFTHSSSVREDLKALDIINEVPYLKSVQLLDKQNAALKTYDFNFNNNSGRLILDSINEIYSTTKSKGWQFSYYGEGQGFPSVFSYSKDHWGYYNASGNTNALPKAKYAEFVEFWVQAYANANRKVDSASTIIGALKTIKYPTGGKTKINYDINTLKFADTSYRVDLGNFLEFNELEYSTLSSIISLNTTSDPEINGSFTLTQRERVTIQASKTDDDAGPVNSIVTLSSTLNGTDIIYSSLPYTCNGISQCTASGIITLEAGTYYYRLVRNNSTLNLDPPDGYASLALSKLVFNSIINYPFGGLRVSSIENTDAVGSKLYKRYIYNNDHNSVLKFKVPYYLTTSQLRATLAISDYNYSLCSPCNREYKIHDESVIPLIGNSIEYRYVTELVDSSGSNGKIDYEFSGSENLQSHGGAPYVTPFLTTWRSGLATNKRVYSKKNGNYSLISHEKNVFDFTYPFDALTNGIKVEYYVYCETEGSDSRTFSVNTVNFQTEAFQPLSSSQTIYDDNSDSLKGGITNLYTSSAHTLSTKTTSVNSKGDSISKVTIYSFDYNTSVTTDNASLAIKNLKDKNVLVPIEEIAIKKTGGASYVTSAMAFVYKSDRCVPSKVYNLKINTPLLLSSFVQSSINGSGNFIKDSHYDEVADFAGYDQHNNVVQAAYTNNVSKCYKYDYTKSYPVTEVVNSDSASIAYTSFEADSEGGWSFADFITYTDNTSPTGNKCFFLDDGIFKGGLANKTYIVSYWSKNGAQSVNSTSPTKTGKTINGWTYYEHQVTATSISISGWGYIDELRLYPKGALMTTYTYTPLVGMTSQCDANNRISYYEYDSFGRLKLVRDQDKNVLKVMDYKYQATPQQ